MFKPALRVVVLFVCFGVSASCGDDAADPASACMSLCTSSGFSRSNIDVQPNETNCFCTGGSGTVSASACMSTCTDIDKTTSQVFGSGAGQTANACQCS